MTYDFLKHFFQTKKNKRRCDHPRCECEGLYKAPKHALSTSSNQDHTWHWFCLKHVRDYNLSWDYFKNMSDQERETQWNRDITWDRPSWPMGEWNAFQKINFQDPFGLFTEDLENFATPPQKIQDEWLDLFDLKTMFSLDELQSAYRFLVKKYHPDINQNDIHAQEKIRKINVGYGILKKRLSA